MGDICLKKLSKTCEWGEGRPYIHVKEDLSLFNLLKFLGETIPPALRKQSMLVICSVGILDIIRILDERGVLRTLEIILEDMKKIRTEFHNVFGKDNIILFADIMPVDICKIVKSDREFSSQTTEETMKLLDDTSKKLVKLCYLLSKSMMVESLSRIQHLPSWNFSVNPPKIKVEDLFLSMPMLENGIHPGPELAVQMSQRLVDLYTTYSVRKSKPDYNGLKRKVYFVCNEKYVTLDKFWPKSKDEEKPVFIFLPSVRSSTIFSYLKCHYPFPGTAIVVIWLDIQEVLNETILMDGDNEYHAEPTRLQIPCFQPPNTIFDSISYARNNLEAKSGTLNIIFTTLCPIDFTRVFQKDLSSNNSKHLNLEPPIDKVLTAVDDYHHEVVDKVNRLLKQSCRLRGLPTWDFCSKLYKRDAKGNLKQDPPNSPCIYEEVAPPTVAKLMMTIAFESRVTEQNLNWMSYYYKKGQFDFDSYTQDGWPVKKPLLNKGFRPPSSLPLTETRTDFALLPNNKPSQYSHDQSQSFNQSNMNVVANLPIAQNYVGQHYYGAPSTNTPQMHGSGLAPGPPPPLFPCASVENSFVSKFDEDFYKPVKENVAEKEKPILPPSKRQKISFGIKVNKEEEEPVACIPK